MSRTIYVNGESMVYVKGMAGSAIANLTELGLSDQQIAITFSPVQRGVIVNAHGPDVPVDAQVFLHTASIVIPLIQYDPAVLRECQRLSVGAPPTAGQMARAGTLLGNGLPRFAAGNCFIGLNIASPVGNTPYRFYFAYLTAPTSMPLGTERTVVTTNWMAIPYLADPWNGGLGAYGTYLYDNTLDG